MRAAWRTLAKTSTGRHSVPGMARLLRRVVEGQDHPPVIYVSNGPWNLAGLVSKFLEREGFPTVAADDRLGLTPTRWFRDGREHKSSALARLAKDLPDVRWVLVGDDGEHDPDLYAAFARSHPERSWRSCCARSDPAPTSRIGPAWVRPGVAGPDGNELLPMLDEELAGLPR